MYATINLPGSSSFTYHGPASRKECEEFLEEQKELYQDLFGGIWWGAYSPARIHTNKEAESWRWRDGSKVIRKDSDF